MQPAPPSSLRTVLDRLVRVARANRHAEMADAGRPPAAACDGRSRLRIASYNVHKCIGTDGTYDPQRTAAVIAEIDADIIALQEADKRFGDREGRLNLALLERETGLRLVPLAMRPASHGWHGNAIFARRGLLTRAERLTLPHAEPRGAVLAEFDFDGRPLRVVAAHLGLLSRSRRLQLETLQAIAGSGTVMPTLLMGDFNEWRPRRSDSPLHQLKPMFGAVTEHRPSFPAGRPVFPLDRIFAWPGSLLQSFEVHVSPLARRASDHLPVKAVIDLAALDGQPLHTPAE